MSPALAASIRFALRYVQQRSFLKIVTKTVIGESLRAAQEIAIALAAYSVDSVSDPRRPDHLTLSVETMPTVRAATPS